MKTIVYKINTSEESLNELGEQGWEVINFNPFTIACPFFVDENATILNQFKEWFNVMATKDRKNRIALQRMGFEFERISTDGGTRYEVIPNNALLQWRIEFEKGTVPEAVAITFGDFVLNIPKFFDKTVIDRYVPKEIIESAMASGSLEAIEIEAEG